MAKKVRRVKKDRQKKSSSTESEETVVNEAAEPLNVQVEQSLSAAGQFRLDYAYVVKDLRRVFILAGAMFALLIILNLVLQ